jgi:hypothetical protein
MIRIWKNFFPGKCTRRTGQIKRRGSSILTAAEHHQKTESEDPNTDPRTPLSNDAPGTLIEDVGDNLEELSPIEVNLPASGDAGEFVPVTLEAW